METLTHEQQINEYLMTALRTMEGVCLKKIERDFSKEVLDKLVVAAGKHITNQHLQLNNGYLHTTNAGKLLADGIAADLFV